MRIAIGGIEHESSNFALLETPFEAFFGHSRSCQPKELLTRTGEINTIIDGFIKGLRLEGVEIVPLGWFHAPSGRQPTRGTHEAVKESLLAPLRNSMPVDGVLSNPASDSTPAPEPKHQERKLVHLPQSWQDG